MRLSPVLLPQQQPLLSTPTAGCMSHSPCMGACAVSHVHHSSHKLRGRPASHDVTALQLLDAAQPTPVHTPMVHTSCQFQPTASLSQSTRPQSGLVFLRKPQAYTYALRQVPGQPSGALSSYVLVRGLGSRASLTGHSNVHFTLSVRPKPSINHRQSLRSHTVARRLCNAPAGPPALDPALAPLSSLSCSRLL